MRIKETKVYPFDELSEDAQEKATENLCDINVDHDWWDFTYEDAAQAKLKLTEFDIGRGNYCQGEFIEYAKDTANAIILNHGAFCPTHETATEFIEDSAKLYMEYPVKLDDDGDDENESALMADITIDGDGETIYLTDEIDCPLCELLLNEDSDITWGD